MAAAYPVSMTLRYLLSARWLEQQILAGDLSAAPERDFVVEFDRLDSELRDRALVLAKRLDFRPYARTGFVRVAGSALDPEAILVRDGFRYSQCRNVVTKIGKLPQLDEPAGDAGEIIEAYEAWLKRYDALAPETLAWWVKKTAPAGDLNDDENDDLPFGGDHREFWQQRIPTFYSDGRSAEPSMIDGRHAPDLFGRARAAQQRRALAVTIADSEDSELAFEILRLGPERPDGPLDDDTAVELWEEHCRRASELMLARYWHRQRQKAGFELEMLRWIADHGSERLKLGVNDGYRMMPVYLNERIAKEAPGFFAHLPKDGEPKLWQPRTGPSEEALRLRRAVQERMNKGHFHSGPPPKVEIGWMKSPPDALFDTQTRTGWDDFEPSLREDPFEIIVIPDWLGRYALIAAVWTPAEEQPPGYILLKHVLRPSDYGLKGLAAPPPLGNTVSEAKGWVAPVGGGSTTGDDDIPF